MKKRHLGEQKDRERVRTLLKGNHPGWVRTRLLAVKMGFDPNPSNREIAKVLEVSEASVKRWFARFRQGGFELLMTRESGNCGRKSGLDDEITEYLVKGLKAARWNTAVQATEDLSKHFGRPFRYRNVWNWLKKCAGVFRIPRPVHEKRDPIAAERFKRFFLGKLKDVALSGTKPMKIWFVDESRYGLLPNLRRVWTRKGLRPHKKWKSKYQWSYCYGAINATSGESVFLQTPSVSQQWTEAFLLEIAKAHPGHEHIIVWDGAGFHPADSDHPRIPEGFHVINLPPYSPELNPIEKLWDLIQDHTANRVWPTIERLDQVVASLLRDWIEDPARVLGLFGKGYHRASANASSAG